LDWSKPGNSIADESALCEPVCILFSVGEFGRRVGFLSAGIGIEFRGM
jgi:hypothetical protein